MELKELQQHLKDRGLYLGLIDGVYGNLTYEAIVRAIVPMKISKDWDQKRRIIAGEQAIYTTMKIETGKIDGLLGPQTRYAREVYEARKNEGRAPSSVETWRDAETKTPTELTVTNTVWPRQKDVQKFYGPVGSNQVKFTTPYPLVIAWNKEQTVNSFSCHAKVRNSMEKVFVAVLEHYGLDEIKRLGLNIFGGCLNVRKMRGGSSWSMHSWGIAVDIDPERNQLKWGKTRAEMGKPEYDAWFRAWEIEGAISLGRERNYDWMHTQFARL